MKIDFTQMDANAITTGKDSDGVRYLQHFLKEYTSVFNETVNPSCGTCINEYLTKYKRKMSTHKNTSGFKLQPKYENMPLGFGSQLLVNSETITEEQGAHLLSYENGTRFFAEIPEDYNTGEKQPVRIDFDAVDTAKTELNEAAPKSEVPAADGPKQEDVKEVAGNEGSALIVLDAAAKLEAAKETYKAAELKLSQLPENVHHKTRKAAQASLDTAKTELNALLTEAGESPIE